MLVRRAAAQDNYRGEAALRSESLHTKLQKVMVPNVLYKNDDPIISGVVSPIDVTEIFGWFHFYFLI